MSCESALQLLLPDGRSRRVWAELDKDSLRCYTGTGVGDDDEEVASMKVSGESIVGLAKSRPRCFVLKGVQDLTIDGKDKKSKMMEFVGGSADIVDKWVVALSASIDHTTGVNMLGSTILSPVQKITVNSPDNEGEMRRRTSLVEEQYAQMQAMSASGPMQTIVAPDTNRYTPATRKQLPQAEGKLLQQRSRMSATVGGGAGQGQGVTISEPPPRPIEPPQPRGPSSFIPRRDTISKYRAQEDFEEQLRAIYSKYNPEKLESISVFVRQFKGR